jgi:DNA polymerase/3'-5' exonuclease PolX
MNTGFLEMTKLINSNATAAAKLEEVARILEEQGANSFRVAAYTRAAATVRSFARVLLSEATLREIPEKQSERSSTLSR